MSTEAAMTAGNRTSAAYYEKEYIPGIYKWGMITNTLGIILAFLPAMVISVVFGITPSFSMIVAGSTLQLMSGTLVSWLVDPIAMYPMLGMPGMFMSFLSGNISNLRLPALAAAQQGANVDAGTEKGNVIATIGIAVSNIVSLLLITGAVLGGSALLAKLPQCRHHIKLHIARVIRRYFRPVLHEKQEAWGYCNLPCSGADHPCEPPSL